MSDPVRSSLPLRADPVAFVRSAEDAPDQVLSVVLERARAGSRPGARSDDHTVCLAIEGGGLRGAVSAGMCVVLEAAGLIGAFDRIYGVSAGALNASATALGQAALSATYYQDAASRRVINPARSLIGRPVIDFDFLFGELIAVRKPLRFAPLGDRPEFRALATSLDTGTLRVLRDFCDIGDVLQAVRASAALPRLAGAPPRFRGEPMTDGGLIEAIPYDSALREGATHVLVLRSRPMGYRRPSLTGAAERMVLRNSPQLAGILAAHQDAYNRLVDHLEHGGDERLAQVTVPRGARLVGRLETNPERVVDALRQGAAAMAAAVLAHPVDLCWQPVAYAAQPAPAPAPAPARALVPTRRISLPRRRAALRAEA